MTKYYRSDSKECYHEELEELNKVLECEVCGESAFIDWDYSSEEDSYYYCIMCSKCKPVYDEENYVYINTSATEWKDSLESAVFTWSEMNRVYRETVDALDTITDGWEEE